MAWYFHVIEQADGTWACRHGLCEYDAHADFDQAIDHARSLAADAGAAELFVHHLDGGVDHYGTA